MLKKDISTSSAGSTLVEYCGPMLVINLPFRNDRRKEFSQTLEGIGLDFDHPNVNLFEASRPPDKGGFPSIGARGCFLSHLRAIEVALEKGWESLIICEDDLDFSPDFSARMTHLFEELKVSKWDIAYFGYGEIAFSGGEQDHKEIQQVAPETGISCTHFLAIRGGALRAAADYFNTMMSREPGDPRGGPMHVDGAYSWFRKDNPNFNTLVVQPPLGHQRPSRTDIHELKLYDRLPIIKSLVGLLRKNRRNS